MVQAHGHAIGIVATDDEVVAHRFNLETVDSVVFEAF